MSEQTMSVYLYEWMDCMEQIDRLHRAGMVPLAIADRLNRERAWTPEGHNRWSGRLVRRYLPQNGIMREV